jgi:ribonuclease-3
VAAPEAQVAVGASATPPARPEHPVEPSPPPAQTTRPSPAVETTQPSGPLPDHTSHLELSPAEQKGLDDLAARLQINFRRPFLLREAMTHASWNNERGEPSGPGHDNERLEYLGDAVLELVVGEYLFRRFPGYDEGQLTQLRASLVNTISLAKLAERLRLGDALLLGKGAAETVKLQANCFEAMIGAIFLDQGYRVATRVFLQSIGDLSEWSDENYKGRLQEAAQLRLGATPSYRVTAVGGPGHRREYRAEAVVAGRVLAEGRGGTKQAAEQAAARLAVEGLTAPEAVRAAPAPARPRRSAPSAEPARARRRGVEVATDRRSGPRPPAVAAAEAPPAPPRGRGLLGALRAAAQGLVKRRAEPEPPPAPAPEPPAPPAQRRNNHRGHRGGRGRHRPSSTPGSPPAGSPPTAASRGGSPSGGSPGGSSPGGAPSPAASPAAPTHAAAPPPTVTPAGPGGSGAPPSPRSAPRSRRRPRPSGPAASGSPPAAPPPQ